MSDQKSLFGSKDPDSPAPEQPDKRPVVQKDGPRKGWTALVFARRPENGCLVCRGEIVGAGGPPGEDQIKTELKERGLELVEIEKMDPVSSYPLFVHVVWNG